MSFGIAEFEAGRVDPERFDHRQHIRIGWLYLASYGKDVGAARFRDALKRFTKSIGAESKYHETITCFFLEEIAARLDNGSWDSFEARNADLFDGKAMISRHYEPETIESPYARRHFVHPDRGRLDTPQSLSLSH